MNKGRQFELAIALILALLLFALSPATEPRVRLTGMVMQLFGVLTIGWGISETRAAFGRPSLAQLLRSTARRLFRRAVVVGLIGSQVSISTSKVRVSKSKPTKPGASLDDRVEALEANVGFINESIRGVRSEIDSEAHTRATAVADERTTREAEDRAIREKLEATGTGGIHISAIGALFLFVGILLSGTSIELAHWFG